MVVATMTFDDPIPGSIAFVAGCGHRAWLAPTGQAQLARLPDLPTVCTRCIPDGPYEMQLAPGAREELAAKIGEKLAAVFIQAVDSYGKRR